MRYKSIKLKNFKPFYSEEQIHLGVEGGTTLIAAKNDRGKTAVLEGIRFCLYDFESDKDGAGLSRDRKRDLCINMDAVQEGPGETFVSLTVLIDGTEYTIKRILTFDEWEDPSLRKHDGRHVKMWQEKQENPLIDTTGEDEIYDYRKVRREILPKEASDYFIFDGERIDSFAYDLGKKDERIREAIEQVLGMRELRLGEDDLQEHALSYYQGELDEVESEAEEYRETKSDLKQAREDLEKLQSDKEKNENKISDLEQEKEHLREELAEAIEAENKYEELIRSKVTIKGAEEVGNSEKYLNESEIERLNPGLEVELKEREEMRNDVYQICGPVYGRMAGDIITEHIGSSLDDHRRIILKHIYNNKVDRCPICTQKLDDVSRETLKQEIKETASESKGEAQYLANIAADLEDSYEEDGEFPYPAKAKRDLEIAKKKIHDLKEDIEYYRDRAKQIQREIDQAEVGDKDPKDLKERKEELEQRLDNLKEEKGKLANEIGNQEEKVEDLREKLGETEGATDREKELEGLIEISADALKAFRQVKNEYIQRQKDRVENNASEIFQEITNKSNVYDGFRITPDYELMLQVGDDIRSIEDQDPSRGARQVIAYSFIDGLVEFSDRSPPLVIDTPIARLDKGHKNRLLNHFPELAEQIIILYQPNELSKENIKSMGGEGEIVNHYDIIQDPKAPDQSIVVDHDEENLKGDK